MDTMEEDTQPTEMITCEDCGKLVAAMNMTIHKVRACNSKPPGRSNTNTSITAGGGPVASRSISEDTDEVIPMDTGDDDDDIEEVNYTTYAGDANRASTPPRRNGNRVILSTSYEAPAAGRPTLRRRRARATNAGSENRTPNHVTTIDDDSEDDVLQVGDVIDLAGPDSPSPSTARASVPTRNASDGESSNNLNNTTNEAEWACPQCTLLNATTDDRCGACLFRNPNSVRTPDRVRTERLIDDGPSSPLMFVSSGALLGGLMGAAGSMIQGRSMVSGISEGALSGAVGGAFLQEVLRNSDVTSSNSGSASGSSGGYNSQNSSGNNIAQSRSSAANGMAAYPSMNTGNGNSLSRQRPRASYRVVQRRGPNGVSTTIVTGGTSTTRISSASSVGVDDPMMSLLLHSMLQGGGAPMGGGGGGNVDGMSYEQLLTAFGDGTENLGAEEGQIHQLPTHILENVQTELPEDSRQCSICLEDFERGETRKTLPCLHGFHEACADKWLRTNGSCPICKHRLS